MACADCCRCCHEPPSDVTDAEIDAVTRLCAIAGTKPYYASRGRYRTRVCVNGSSRTDSLPEGGYMRGSVFENNDEVRVFLELGMLPVELAEAILRVAYGAPVKQHERRPIKRKKARR